MDNNQLRTSVPLQGIDAESSLKLTESRSIINQIYLDLCGLQIQSKGSHVELIRVSRPTFTYEFAKLLTQQLYIEVNRITARTSYKEDHLKRFYLLIGEKLADLLYSQGFHKLISEKAWKAILAKDRTDPETANLPASEHQTLWESNHFIKWDYDSPVNDDMLDIVKEEENLNRESFGQKAVLSTVYWSIMIFIQGGLNRSGEALTLDHEKMIHKESIIMNNDKPRRSEGAMDRVKNAFIGTMRR